MKNDRKRKLIAVFETDCEAFEIEREAYEYERDFQQFGREVLVKAGIYNEPDDHHSTQKIQFFEKQIKNDQIERVCVKTMQVVPFCRQRTELEHNRAMDEAVKDLPEEFQAYVREQSWDRGHSSGWNEVLNYARSIASELEPIINKYKLRILADYPPAP